MRSWSSPPALRKRVPALRSCSRFAADFVPKKAETCSHVIHNLFSANILYKNHVDRGQIFGFIPFVPQGTLLFDRLERVEHLLGDRKRAWDTTGRKSGKWSGGTGVPGPLEDAGSSERGGFRGQCHRFPRGGSYRPESYDREIRRRATRNRSGRIVVPHNQSRSRVTRGPSG